MIFQVTIPSYDSKLRFQVTFARLLPQTLEFLISIPLVGQPRFILTLLSVINKYLYRICFHT